MLHGLADPQNYDRELRIHIALNSWMAEGQWHTLRPSEMGFVENERTSRSEAQAGSIGSWSTERYLPMAMAENIKLGLTWFWQIEHNGSWYWEISNVSARDNNADDVYAYLGGPDDLHSAAWKRLKPGETYETVPVAIGCVHGGFSDAVEALTRYRRAACEKPRNNNSRCAVIFNDYMNCLWGDPTEDKELPLIAAAAKAGCEYFVIDAGWYADLHEDWSPTIGSWQPSPSSMAARPEVRARSDPASWNDSGIVARAGSCRGKIPPGSETRRLVPSASWQKSVEKLAVPAGFPQPGGARLPRPGDRKAGERLRRRLHQDGLQRRFAARNRAECG